MPFLLPLAAPLISGAVAAGAGALGSALSKGQQSTPVGPTNPITSAIAGTPGASGVINQTYNNSQNAIDQQTQLQQALAAQNGIGNQSQVFSQEQALQGQLGQLAAGQGPNPAQAQLQQATGQNVANQAALMAGQRGAGANAGLLARQAAQQGASTQQQAVGQAATLQAQQQIAALQAQQQQQANLANLATTQVGQQQNATNAAASSNLTAQQLANQAVQGQNQISAGQQEQVNQIQNQQGMQQAQFTQNLVGGAAGGIGSGLASTLGLAEGGEIQQGGPEVALKENYKGKSRIGGLLYAKGGKAHKTVDALVSPGEIYLSPDKAKKAKEGKMSPLKGEKIKGTPAVGGAVNSYANDTVPKKLKQGGIVLPRSVTQSADPAAAAHAFVSAIKSKR